MLSRPLLSSFPLRAKTIWPDEVDCLFEASLSAADGRPRFMPPATAHDGKGSSSHSQQRSSPFSEAFSARARESLS